MMSIQCYPYRFVKKDTEIWGDTRHFMLYRMLYSFRSTKTHQTYWVWVEVYQKHFYAVKFHLKNHRQSDHKYNLMTGLNEPRPCIRTCMAIMEEIARKDDRASFGFIGANCIGEPETNTKRFRVYRRFMMTCFGTLEYEHRENWEKSAYVMLNRKEMAKDPMLLHDITTGFKALYPYFDR